LGAIQINRSSAGLNPFCFVLTFLYFSHSELPLWINAKREGLAERREVEENMNHFPPGDWIDLARGALPASQAARMQNHLSRHCDECLRSDELWRLVLNLATTEAGYKLPDRAVMDVKNAYGSARPERWLPQMAEFGRLLFDSFRQPDVAMVRAAMQSSRQLLHEVEPFIIDLRLESDPLRKRTSLTGQILNSEHPDQSTGEVDVVLLSGENLVKRTVANAQGEFELDFRPEDGLQLFINIRGQRAIGIVLPELET
jgi:hypothetical protein